MLITIGWFVRQRRLLTQSAAILHPPRFEAQRLAVAFRVQAYLLPVPMNVLAEMERNPEEHLKVRDRMLSEMGWCSTGIPRPEWKAASLNKLFQEQGCAAGRAQFGAYPPAGR